HFFNSVGIVLLFMMLMAHQLYRDDEWGFEDYVKKFFTMAGTWIGALGEPFHRVKKTDAKTKDPAKDAQRKQTGAVLCGVLAAAVMLMMIIPLLMSSDRIFSQI